jgi:3-oxoacyl-[acyl-carrier protein] reductase
VTQSQQVDAAVAQVLDRFGSIEILVNCAGKSQDAPLSETTDERWRAVQDINLGAAFFCSRAVVPTMLDRQYGRIINISSRSLLGDFNRFSYSAAKAGLIGLTSSLALDFARSGITVNAIAPGMIETEHAMSVRYYPQLRERALVQIPVGRMGTPGDIADSVLFLASQCASYITGELLFVTGGRHSTAAG